MQALTKQARPSWLTEAPQGLAVTRSRAVVDGLKHQSNTREQTVQKRLPHTPSDEPLRPVAGIGTIVAPTITRATGAIRRWPSVGNEASSCRCVERNQSSHGKRTGTGHGKHGHPSWAWASREAAQGALRFPPAAQRFSQRQLAQSRNPRGLARHAVAPQRSRAGDDRMRDLVPCAATQAGG